MLHCIYLAPQLYLQKGLLRIKSFIHSFIHPHLLYGLNLWGFKQKRITVLQKKAVRIIAFRPYISHSTSAFKELQITMLKELHYKQLYKIYYKNVNNLLPAYFRRFSPNYDDGIDHNHDLRYNGLRLPMARKEYYVQCTKYKFRKLIMETSRLDLDRCLTFSITHFIRIRISLFRQNKKTISRDSHRDILVSRHDCYLHTGI